MEILGLVEECDELTHTLDCVEYGGQCISRAGLHAVLDRLQDTFTDLLVSTGPDAQLRQAVQSGQIEVESLGKRNLSKEDAILIVQISDDLQISESDAVQYLLRANQEGSYTAEVALGLYFLDRMSVLTCLHRLFSLLAFNEGTTNPDSNIAMILVDVKAFCDSLLSPTQNGHSKLVQRLVQLIKHAAGEIEKGEDRLDARFQSLPAGSPSSMVYDFMGGYKPKSVMWAEEQRMLCETLLLAIKVYSRVTVNSIMDLFGLMMELHQRIHETNPTSTGDHHIINGLLVLFSLLMTLLPQDMQQRMSAANTDERKLEELAQNTQLSEILSDDPAESDPFGCLVRFAWGVLKANYRVTATAGKELVRKCSSVGVLNALYHILSDEHLKTQCQLEIHGLCLSTAHNLVVHFLEIENKNIIGKVHALYKVTKQRMLAHWNQGVTIDDHQDHLCLLLDVLTEIYEHRPDLILFGQPPEAILKFIGWVPDSGLLHQSPEVLNSFVLLWSAISTGDEGAKRIHNQLYLSQKEGFHTISKGYERCQWGFIISTLIKFTMAVKGSEHTRAKQVGKDDLKGLLAYLKLIRKVLSEAPLADAAVWISDLEREYQEPLSGHKIQDVLIHLLCQPVPHELKAAVNKTLVAFGRTTHHARQLLASLKNCTILRYQSKQQGNETAFDRYDLLYQLNQIEASAEDYPESLAFITLINTLMRNAHPVPDQALVVADCTTFVTDGLLPRLGHLKFQSPTQLWELMAACFTHLKLVLDSTNFNPEVVESISMKSESRPPGYGIIEDILGGGRILGTICQILTRSIRDFQLEGFTNSKLKNAKHDAVIAALAVLRTVFVCDKKYLKGVEEKIRMGGMAPLDKLLLNMQREELFSLIGYVSVPCGAIQVEAIALVRYLAARRSGFMELFAAGSRYANEVISFKEGFARALHDGLHQPRAVEDLESTVPPSCDLRASLVLRVLLENIPDQSVNLGHLLCGYDAAHGLDCVRTSNLVERKGNSCLLVILEALKPALSVAKPQLYVNCLEVIQELAQHPDSAPSLINLLRSDSYGMLFDLLPDIGDAADVLNLPQGAVGYWVVVQSQACLVDILTRVLLVLQPGMEDKDWAVCVEMLKRLLGLTEETESEVVPFLSILRKIPMTLHTPSVPQFLSSEAMKALEDYGKGEGGPQEILSLANKPQDEGGIMYKSRTGQTLFDYRLVCGKFEGWLESFTRRRSELSLGGDDFETLRHHLGDGCSQISSYTMAHNAHVKLQTAIIQCLEACSSAVSSMMGKRWGLLTTVCDSSGRFTSPQLVVQLASIVINMIVESDSPQVALPLCRILHTVVTRLKEEAMRSKKAITDLLILQEGPDLLSGMVSTLSLSDARVDQQGKQLLMSGMTLFLTISKCDPTHLMLQSARFIHENAFRVISILNKEVNNEPAGVRHQLIALQSLRQVVSVEGSISIVETILSKTNLYQDITGALKMGVMAYMSPGASGHLEDTTVARLELILEMLCTGGPQNVSEIARIMNSYQVIEWVCSSSVLEFLPKEWPARNARDMLVFSKLQKMVILVLTIIDKVVSGLDGSGDARQRAVDIIESCFKQFRAVLLRACSQKWGDWQPSRPDIEMATLAIGLLAIIGMEHFSTGTRSLLHEAVNRAAGTFCCLTSASESPFVAEVMNQPVRGMIDQDGTSIWYIRKALMSYYHKVLLYRQVNQGMVADAVDLPTPHLQHEAVQQSLVDLKKLLEERNWSFDMNGIDASLIKQYRKLLEDRVYILLNCCRIGSYSLIAWFKRRGQFGAAQGGWMGQGIDFSQHLMTEVDPLVQRVLEMGPRDASGFREMDEAWRLLKVHVEMQDRDKTLGIGT